MKKKLFALFAVLTLIAGSINAQTVKVSGTVSDSFGPVAGAAVLVQGTTTGTVTDLDGTYSFNVPANAVLEVSCIGYKTVTEAVNGRAVVNFTLSEDSELLADAVVLGYGAATKKKDLSAAVGVVATPEQLAAHPVTSTEAMLQGQLPGVTITSNGGSPDSNPSIVIRGQGSKNGDSVLWVVDGVPGAPINSLSDIESIVVLKDAASAAIYGAQSGAGGVILVTTKKAKEGLSVSYDGLVGVRQATNLIQPLNAEQELQEKKLAYGNAGQPLPDAWNVEKDPWVATTRTNWMDEIFRTALYHRHNVVLNAGTDKAKNRISFTSDNNDGVLQNTYKNKIGINYRGEFQINKWVKLTEDLNWSQTDSRGIDTNSGYTGAVLSAIYFPASASLHMYDGTGWGGTYTEDPEYLANHTNYAGTFGDINNPMRLLHNSNRYNRANTLFTTTGLEVANIVKGLKFNSRFTYVVSNGFTKNFEYLITEIGRKNVSNGLYYDTYRNNTWKTENTLSYDRTFGKHNVGALLATTADHYVGYSFHAEGKDFADEAEILQYMKFAKTKSASDGIGGPDANVAFVGRLSYSYDDRYFVTASWRRDYAGRLPQGHNYGDFPAVTGAWKISSEPFFPKNDVLTFMKLRASWGRIGNLGSIGMNYKAASISSGGTDNEFNPIGLETSQKLGTYYFLSNAVNSQLTWETSEQFDLGLDLSFFKDRLSAGFDFYNKRTFNLIQDQSTGWPQTIGVSAMKVNLGEVMNRGFEMQLGWADKVGDFNYYINANAAYNKNWVSDIGVLNEDGSKGVWTGGGSYRMIPYIYRTEEGQPLDSYYLIKCLGIFQSMEDVYDHQKDGQLIQPNAQPGDLKFEDFNGDGKINDGDRQYFGNAVPDWTYALTGGFDWKGFTFSMMLQGVLGAQAAYVGKYSIFSDMEQDYNKAVGILDAWSENNRGSNIPRLSKNDNNNNFATASTWYLEDASYLRIKNVTIGYDITNALRKMTHFAERNSSCMVYFSGENLFTFTKYSGMDPECGGYDALKYPVSRVLSFGVKLTY